jgi:septum formation protein
MRLILGSGSPRRKFLLEEMGYSFEVLVSNTDESFDTKMDVYKVAPFLANKKAKSLVDKIEENDVLLCCDTVVIFKNSILGKPSNANEALKTIQLLSGNTHEVVSAVSLVYRNTWIEFHETTQIVFDAIKPEDIQYYIDSFNPLDKAGAYGIQEWIGLIAVKQIKGSYTNVIGLPTQRLHRELQKIK